MGEGEHELGSVFSVPFCLCLDGQQINVSSKKLTIINTSKVTTERAREGEGQWEYYGCCGRRTKGPVEVTEVNA